MPIVKDYLGYTQKWKKEYGEKTIVLMQCGSFFEVYAAKNKEGQFYGSDIVAFSTICDMIIAPKSKMFHNKDQVHMAGFGLAQLDKYVKKLQEAGYTIAVYLQDVQGKNTTRSLSEIISPGTFFSQEPDTMSNVSMCIWLEHTRANKVMPESVTAGVSTIDIYTGKTTLHQSTVAYHHNPSTYDEVERLVAIHRPSECLIVSNLEDNVARDVISFVGLDDTKTHIVKRNDKKSDMGMKAKNADRQVYQMETFRRFYPNLSEEVVVTAIMQTHSVAVQGFVLLLDFVHSHSPQLTSQLEPPTFETHSDRLLLANHSLRQLNIIDDSRHSGKLRSVGALLNNCATVMGKRKFMYDLHHPVTDTEFLTASYDHTADILESGRWEDYRHSLSGMRDLEKLKRKLVINKVTPRDLASLAGDIKTIVGLAEGAQGEDFYDYLRGNGDPITSGNALLKNLSDTFNLEICMTIDDMSSEKLSNTSPSNLAFVRRGVNSKIDDLLDECLDSRLRLDAMANALSGIVGNVEKSSKTRNFVKIHETPKSDPVLIATKRRAGLLKHQLAKLESLDISIEYSCHDSTKKTVVLKAGELEFGSLGSNKKDELITSPQIKSLANRVQKAADELVFELIGFYGKYISTFAHLSDLDAAIQFATNIDVLHCKAYIARKFNYCKPAVVSECAKSFVSFTGIRHPLIEHIQTSELYVTNDLTIGLEASDNMDGLLLYGTNAVGKTSFIKSVGVAIVMAQAGLYVPCASFRFAPYTALFTRILGNDNLFKGLSTFAVEMSELRTILTLADSNSLILGDELCSGTESDSALSIFTAGLESLHEKESTFLFATHFHEIINFEEIQALNRLTMMHMEVTYDQERDVLIYDRKLRPGAGNSMYGLEVCKSLNLPQVFLRRAHDIRTKYNATTQGVLSAKGSHFNARKLGGNCEICKTKKATEVHHLQHQAEARGDNSYIGSFHKNHPANLMNICDDCHDTIHKDHGQHRVVRTTDGYELASI